jgi:hypothetical protein
MAILNTKKSEKSNTPNHNFKLIQREPSTASPATSKQQNKNPIAAAREI